MGQARYVQATFASGASVSDSFVLQSGEMVVAIETPAAWTAADIAVQVSRDGTNFVNLFDNAAAANANAIAKVVTAANELHFLSAIAAGGSIMVFAPIGPTTCRLQSQTAGALTTVNQGAERVCQVLVVKQ